MISLQNVTSILMVSFTIVLLFVFIFSSGCLSESGNIRSCQSNYHYSISIDTNHPVTNVTFLIPLPYSNNSLEFKKNILNDTLLQNFRQYQIYYKNGTEDRNYEFPAGYPSDYKFQIVSIEDYTFLKITAEKISPENPISYKIWLSTEPVIPYLNINTLHPEENESVFNPKLNFSRYYTAWTYFSRYTYWNNTFVSSSPTEYIYDIPVYADYSISNNTCTLSIQTTAGGENYWRSGYDNEGSNRYSDSVSISITGDSSGWQTAKGTLLEGEGDYPRDLFDMPGFPPMKEWGEVECDDKFSPRIDPGVIVFNDKLWVIGGKGPGGKVFNDVWSSSDGEKWTCINASAEFPPTKECCLLSFNNKLWLIGGVKKSYESGIYNDKIPYTAQYYKPCNDIWYSEDGNIWTLLEPERIFPERTGHQCLVYDNRMWVIGGTTYYKNSEIEIRDCCPVFKDGMCFTENTTYYLNETPNIGLEPEEPTQTFSDVWYSYDGSTWKQAISDAPFGPRYDHRAVVYQDNMYIAKGNGYNDIWSSSDGITWICVSDQLPFNKNNLYMDYFGFVEYDSKMWFVGGNNYLNGFSDYLEAYSRDGKTWETYLGGPAGRGPGNCGIVVFRDRIWRIGGENKIPLNDILYTPSPAEIPPIRRP